MRRILQFSVLALCTVIIYSSCANDKSELLYPCDPYDTLNMKYRANVVPIMEGNCYSCHAGSMPTSGIRLDSYTELKKRVTNGKLIGSITHTGAVSPMPQGQPKMSDCNINKIKAWVNAGALDN